MPEKEILLRSRDVAHILDAAPDDVIVLARKGKLKATRHGHYWRYRLSDVMAYKRRQQRLKEGQSSS